MDELKEKNKELQITYNEKKWDPSPRVSPETKRVGGRLQHQDTVTTILSEVEGRQSVKGMMDTHLRKTQFDLRKA